MMDLRAERDYWHAYAKQLEAVLAPVDEIPLAVRTRLTNKQALILAALISSGARFCSTERLVLAIYRDRDLTIDPLRCIWVLMCQLRRRLAPFGMEIESTYSIGYRLTENSRERIAALAKAEEARAA